MDHLGVPDGEPVVHGADLVDQLPVVGMEEVVLAVDIVIGIHTVIVGGKPVVLERVHRRPSCAVLPVFPEACTRPDRSVGAEVDRSSVALGVAVPDERVVVAGDLEAAVGGLVEPVLDWPA